MNKACKTYYKNLKLFLPIHKAKEKQLFQDIKSALTNLSEKILQLIILKYVMSLVIPKKSWLTIIQTVILLI